MSNLLDTSGLDAILAGLSKANDDAADETADEVVSGAQALVPVQTGALKTSIEKFGAEGSGKRTAEAGQGLDYAGDVEYENTPYMTPAAEHVDHAAIWKRHVLDLISRSAR